MSCPLIQNLVSGPVSEISYLHTSYNSSLDIQTVLRVDDVEHILKQSWYRLLSVRSLLIPSILPWEQRFSILVYIAIYRKIEKKKTNQDGGSEPVGEIPYALWYVFFYFKNFQFAKSHMHYGMFFFVSKKFVSFNFLQPMCMNFPAQ